MKQATKVVGKKEAKKVNKEIAESRKIPELKQIDTLYFKELVDASNKYIATKKQKAQYEFTVKKLQDTRNKIKSGEIKMPVTMTLIPNMMYHQEYDKKRVLKLFDDQIETYQTNVKSLIGMIQHNYDEYMESAVRTREFVNRRFATAKAKDIAPERKVITDEENLFEAEFKDLMNDPEKQQKLKEASKEAAKRNLARKQKGKN